MEEIIFRFENHKKKIILLIDIEHIYYIEVKWT